MRIHSCLYSIPFAVAGALLAPPANAVGLQLGHRPEIGSVGAPKSAKAGETVKITIAAKKDGSSGCGLLVRFGDGSDQQIKINRDEAKFPVSVEHAWKKDGKYTVSASGKEITTNKACKGGATAVIQVGEPKKAKTAKPRS